ncbi:NAD(P)/FAD-dependent oxidoreductase [Domibacillus sp. PGB-M46]|uniref:NAD(P)/FAD-dependent oxidoreductase n=1 Tax=Domibacillus sp. PGB-M46 TaxID=2910255 RepID=UPI001F58320B|nr:NAD(P)/FAD-dependent oxidoreductase [Domibacillus sp. PGB-M46]MCI2255586.1 NAD(P)/FAD-dependent oxidoreductase [Domibacillus sp. PGB-M46]
MNVAIMGAGLSGLACAITLEKNGIYPTIFEKRSRVGDRFVNGEVLLSIFYRPVHDCIASLSDDFGIYLKPASPIHKLELFSKNEKAVIEGQLGFTNIRGREQDSFESQLEKQTKSTIHFNSEKTYEQLLSSYSHVILATGDGEYAKRTKNYREDLTVSIKGATVEGVFDRYSVTGWLNYDMAPFGCCYLIPYSEKEAHISLSIPDLPKNKDIQINNLWDKFYDKVRSQLNQELPITDQFQITNYSLGICQSARIGNTFYAGNCFGTLMPFLGFGQYASILSGIYAAYDLCGLGKYEELMKPIRQGYDNSLVLRRAMDQLSNNGLDRIVHALQGTIGEKLFQSNLINPLKVASYLLRPYIKMTK